MRRVALGVGLVLAGLAVRASTAEARTGCSDYTPDHRACTYSEQLSYCLTSVSASYNDCSSGTGILGTLGCSATYEVSFYGCYSSSLVTKVFY